jgi:DNA-binding IclR family transcriptional regulator
MPRSTDRAFDILEMIGANKDGLTHGKIAQGLNIPKSSLSKLLSSLMAKNYLTFDKTSRTYTVGPQVLFLASSYLARLDIVRVAQPIIREAMMKTGESASLMIRSGNEGLIVCKENSPHIVIARFSIGTRVPLYATAGGKVLLAFLSTEQIEQYISSVDLSSLTRKTITKPDKLKRELKAIRANGLAYCNGEQFEDLDSMAAPVFAWDGRIAAAIGTPFPKIRSNKKNKQIIENVLRKSAAEISQKLGLSGTFS